MEDAGLAEVWPEMRPQGDYARKLEHTLSSQPATGTGPMGILRRTR